jgi:hypothetical protein
MPSISDWSFDQHARNMQLSHSAPFDEVAEAQWVKSRLKGPKNLFFFKEKMYSQKFKREFFLNILYINCKVKKKFNLKKIKKILKVLKKIITKIKENLFLNIL